MMKSFVPVLVLALTGFSLPVQAVVVTDRWSAELTSVINTSAFSIGDSISWLVTYDDESTLMNYYDDGTDGVGGTVDDVTYTAGTACPYCTYTMTANAQTDLASLVSQLISGVSNYASAYDFYSINYDRTYDQRTPAWTYNEYVRDDVLMLADNYNGGSRNYLQVYYNQTNSPHYNVARIGWGQVTIEQNVTITPAPAPAVLSLFGLGLAGIGLLRRRHKIVAIH